MDAKMHEVALKTLENMAERDDEGTLVLRGKAVDIAAAMNDVSVAEVRLARLIHEEIVKFYP